MEPMVTDGEVEASGRARGRTGDWVWNLYPGVVFGLAAFILVWTFPTGDIEHVSPFFSVSHVDTFITRWFLCFPILLVTPFLALWFVRSGGAERLRSCGDSFQRIRPWWVMTRRALGCHGTLLAFLLAGLVIGTLREGLWRGDSLPSRPLLTAVVLGVVHIVVAVGVLLPDCLFSFAMYQHGDRGYCVCGVLFLAAHIMNLVLSGLAVWSWDYPDSVFQALLESPALLFIVMLSLANVPLLLIVPLREAESRDDSPEISVRAERSTNPYHWKLALACMATFLITYTGLFLILEMYERRHFHHSTLLGAAATPVLDLFGTFHPALAFCIVLFVLLTHFVSRTFYPSTLGKPGPERDRGLALGWLVFTVLFLISVHGTLVYQAVRIPGTLLE
jgi:hypothetical protein